MFLLNLSLLQFAAIFGSLLAISVALYLLDRSRRRQVVSSLRFWTAAEQPAVAARRRHINQPWSLLLQLASMALLLLAIAQLRIGTPAQAGRDHVLILDCSSWMAAHSGRGTFMDTARRQALQYVRAVPGRDRVMLVRADALATPVTAFEPDHRQVEAAIRSSQPGATALNLDQALAFARHMQAQEGRRAGEIAFVGTGRIAERDPGTALGLPRNLRVLPVADTVDNYGLRKIGLRRSTTEPNLWEIYVSVWNYGKAPHTVTLGLHFGAPPNTPRTTVAAQHLELKPGVETEASFTYRTGSTGILAVGLSPHDAFPNDDQAELELPTEATLPVTVYSAEPALLRPALGANPRVTATYRKPEEFRPNDRGLVVLDRFIPAQRPTADSIWIDPPAQGSPIPVRSVATDVAFEGWSTVHPAAAGLRAKDFKLDRTSVFEAAADDERIGEVAAGPVIVARASRPKVVTFGFHPALSGMRYELATPLLFANLLRWVSPELFRRSEITVGSVGSVKVVLDQQTAPADIKVSAEDGSALPFTLHDRTIDFFSGSPGKAKVIAGDREYLYSLTLPQVGNARWTPGAETRQGVPRFSASLDTSSDLWQWLALAGGMGLLVEWLLFGRFRRSGLATRPILIRGVKNSSEVRQ